MKPETVCDLCGALQGKVVLVTPERRFGLGGQFRVIRCSHCGLVRTEPRPEDISRFYPDDDYYAYSPASRPSRLAIVRARRAYGLTPDGSLMVSLLARVSAARLTPGLPPGPPGDVLDVGCGSGAALLLLEKAGWRCHGIDLSEDAVAAAQAAGLAQVRSGDLIDARYPSETFDVVRFWHSLEHTASPRAQLEEARRLLRPGGRVLVGVPNFGSILARIARERWFYLDVPRHLWHFDRQTLGELATKAGFLSVRVRHLTTSTPLAGTLAGTSPWGGRVLRSRLTWLALLPFAALLDGLRLGDALELTASVDR